MIRIYTLDAIKHVIAATLEVPIESISDDDSPATLSQWDSLAHLNLVMALEQNFGVKFTLDEILGLRDVRTIQRALRQKSGA
jgi:acyl carrier protein